MKGAVNNVLEAIGNTPLVRLNRVAAGVPATIYAKLEYMNPAGSMKDRITLRMVDDFEKQGLLKPGGTIVEATSGNTGAGLAQVAAVRGYTCIFVMPDKMSEEKVKALRAYGAKVVVCPTAVEPEDPRSYYSVAKRLARETPGAVLANQYYNPSNPDAHYDSTGPELWRQTDGLIDVFVSGMGTGGTLSGTGKFFKEKNPSIQIVGVDPIGSVYYDYFKTGTLVQAKTYKVEGIGEDFLPGTMNLKILDDIVRVTDKECFHMTRRLVREEGIFCGGSGGAAVAGAVKYAKKVGKKANIVVLLPDSASRYLSKVFDDHWMREWGFLDTGPAYGLVGDILKARPARNVLVAQKTDRVTAVIQVMQQHGISQMPVMDGGRLVGLITEVDLLHSVLSGKGGDATIDAAMSFDYATADPATNADVLPEIFAQGKVVVVLSDGEIVGMITKIDLIEYLARAKA
ncbi:MAG: cystathionine beta-synthase [Deltaproteobacteria bacterium]|nr:cystathionine beta-synthase [Deltaproteobacteria bacterium]